MNLKNNIYYEFKINRIFFFNKDHISNIDMYIDIYIYI